MADNERRKRCVAEKAKGHGFMYGRSFEDPDSHIWELMWMDLKAAKNAPAA